MPPDLYVQLPAEPGAAGRSRRETGRWLAALCGVDTPCNTMSDLVLAVNEAVSNSIEHAYAGAPSDVPEGTVTLRGDVEQGPVCPRLRVRFEVTDTGCWRDPSGDPGYRGRGLSMIEACADDVDVERGPDGTTVVFHGTLGRCPGFCA
ncbi:ATP-binding protein [Pseudonocardia phyllosphaerae]|uniref:ATP-binding protein n=1 Tax=Pseudonocardia phyllosphaerae TaxID=3390502 RepID=UPI00397C0536